MIGGRYAARTTVASVRSEHRYRSFTVARERADRIDGVVWDHVEQREVWESPGAGRGPGRPKEREELVSVAGAVLQLAFALYVLAAVVCGAFGVWLLVRDWTWPHRVAPDTYPRRTSPRPPAPPAPLPRSYLEGDDRPSAEPFTSEELDLWWRLRK